MQSRRLISRAAALLAFLIGTNAHAEEHKPTRLISICVRLEPGQQAWSTTAGDSIVVEKETDFQARAGKTIFKYDATAPRDNIKYLPKRYQHLRCPGDTRAVIPGMTPPQASPSPAGGSPQKGTGSGSSTSAQNDREVERIFKPGRSLTWIDKLAQNMVIAGAFVSGNTGETLRHPQGVAGGIPGGKNIGGPDLPILQFGVGLVMITAGVVTSVVNFEEKIAEAGIKKIPLIIEKDAISKEIAEELVKKYGDELVNALHQMKVVLPYDVAQMLTKNYGHVFEAHHIFETAMMKTFGDDAAKAPVVILLKEEHRKITTKLAAEKAALGVREQELTKAQLWTAYKRAYTDTPHYLDAIRHYFRDVL